MTTSSWRKAKFLNDEELLAAAEEAVLELEQLPLDNAFQTDEDDSDEEEHMETRETIENSEFFANLPTASESGEVAQNVRHYHFIRVNCLSIISFLSERNR